MSFLAMKTLVLLSIVLFAGCIGTSNERPNPVKAEDPNSIYHRLGGQPALDAAVELFYVKILADKTVNHHFKGINMAKQKARQKQFLAAAFGGPVPYTGRGLRKAHRHLDLNESDFNTIAGHLQASLKELKINDKLIAEVMAVTASTKDEVLDK